MSPHFQLQDVGGGQVGSAPCGILWKVIVHPHTDLFFLLSSMEFCVRFILKTDLPRVALPFKKSTLKMTRKSIVPVVFGTLVG